MKLPLRVIMLSHTIYPDGVIDPEDDFTDRVESVVDADGKTFIYTEGGYFTVTREDAERIANAVNSTGIENPL